MMLGQPCCPHGHPDDLALGLLQCHLGSGMSSLLFRRLREDHGVAYDVGAHHRRELELRRSSCVPPAAPNGLAQLSLLHQSWQELRIQPLSEDDLTLARAKSVARSPMAARPAPSRLNGLLIDAASV